MGKTNYWLRLKKDYFNSIAIKKMRTYSNGDAMAIVYLKLQLEAIETEGIISFLGFGETIAEELSLTIGEDVSIVQETLDFLCKYDIASVDNSQVYFQEVSENIEKECDAAERMRRMRAKRAEEA